jgi:F420-dependent oxidoreductase-like protein
VRIGLTGFFSNAEQVVRHAERAEADGFTSLWFPGAGGSDPLLGITLAARATSTIEMGTSVLQMYPCHPVLMAARAAAVASAVAAPGRFTLGVGPSHRPSVEDVLGLSYDTPGRFTDEYVQVLTGLLAGHPSDPVSFEGEELQVHADPPPRPGGVEVPVLLAALGPRLLRVAGTHAAGTILWMGNAQAIESHVAPRITEAASAAGRAQPRIVAGLPVAVHDDEDEARALAAEAFAVYGTLPNYQRLLAHGGISGPAEAALVGTEESVAGQIEALFAAGATDLWAAPFPVGDDPKASTARTRALLKDLLPT